MTPQELKNSILQLAIQGKLVEQRPEEGTGEELYRQIQTEKAKLIAEGKIKKEKPLPEITEDEVPFDIPESWHWVRLKDVVFSRGQETPVETFSYIDIGSIDNRRQCLNSVETLVEPENAPSRARKLVELGDIIYSTVRPYLHNTCIIDRTFSHKPIASTGFAVMTCYAGVFNRYSSISQGTIKNLLHAMGALYLLNIYYKNINLSARYLDVHNLDFSLGSSIFSVKQPGQEYVISIINNQDITDILHADESPFVLKYTDSYYKQILDTNKTLLEEMNSYWLSQPELQEPEFIQQMMRAKEKEDNDPSQKLIPFWELAKYRLRKKIPASLPFEERKKLFISSPEWNGQIRQQNAHLNADDITEANIQSEIDHAGVLAGMELQQQFERLTIKSQVPN